MFNVVISVPEEWSDYELLKSKCDHLLSNRSKVDKINVIVTDRESLGEKYANERGFGLLYMPIDWKKFGKSAAKVRDAQILDMSNACIVFFSSYSKNIPQQSLYNISVSKRVPVRKIEEDN